MKGYHDYMVDVAVFLGADRDIATTQLFDALQFEIALANVSATNQATNSQSYLIR